MMTSSTERVRLGFTAFWVATAALALGCTREDLPSAVGPVTAPLRAGLLVSRLDARPGDTVVIQILVERTDAGRLAGVQGALQFDARALRYLGQPLAGNAFVLVNASRSATGVLRVASLRVQGLAPATADLWFEVVQAEWLGTLRYRLEEAATPDGFALYRTSEVLPARAVTTLSGPVAILSLEDWWGHFQLSERAAARVPGQGSIYGDVTFNGFTDVLDASAVANLAVGNRSLLTEANRDYVIAGDVAPANLPGLGEFTDPLPPGRNADGSHTLTVLDAVEVQNEAVGNDRPITGEAIPGRTPRPHHTVLLGTISTSRTLFRDTVYELQGLVLVGAGATLTIEAGTRIEGDGPTRGALMVARAGNINARGSRIEPIVFTCKSATPTPGCWGGVVLNGLALLNHRDQGTLGFCPEKFSPGSTELYGGCLVEDTAGVMQYVRIEHAGMSAGLGPAAGLALLGVGSGTVVENVQVHGSLGDGIFVSGGNVNLRRLVLSGNLGSGLHWDHGWGGNAFGGSVQFVQVQVPSNGGDAIVGSNLIGNPAAGPLSEPDLYNVTVIGGGTGSGRGLVLQDGSRGTVRNTIIQSSGSDGFDVEGIESCNQVSAGFTFFDHNIVFANTPDYAADVDCLDEAAYASTPALQNRIVDPGLLAPANTLTPDTRPAPGTPPLTGWVSPPSNLFFDLTADYIGAAPPANATRTNVPWYAGWSRGWSGAP